MSNLIITFALCKVANEYKYSSVLVHKSSQNKLVLYKHCPHLYYALKSILPNTIPNAVKIEKIKIHYSTMHQLKIATLLYIRNNTSQM